jgi:hypothetical protein
MSWFQTLALHAHSKGHRAKSFAVAAQRHANAFWFVLIGAGIVWWLAGWKWALIPAAVALWLAFKSLSATLIQGHLETLHGKDDGSQSSGESKSSFNAMQDIVRRYGRTLEAHATRGSIVSDVSMLPIPKDDLRKVLITLITAMPDGPQREQLKSGYMMLPDFQPGVGTRIIKIDPDMSKGVHRATTEVLDEAKEFERWSAITLAESTQLKLDLDKLAL